MLVNWKIEYCDQVPADKQPPDYYVKGEPYWFFRYFNEQPEVDVVDIRSLPWLEKIERNRLRFYVWQTLRVLPKLHKYDLIISHGAQSGVVLMLWRRLFKTKAKHILFDIGSFNSAAESGFALKLMQFASKSLDGVIYHTSSQLSYYEKFFPWIVDRSDFVRFGADLDFFNPAELTKREDCGEYILCVGSGWRDWDTLIKAYQKLDTDVKLRLIGDVDERYTEITGVEQFGRVPVKELIQQIYNAKFCVLSLQWRNYSCGQMTLTQQMALGKCVVVSRVPSLVDYVQDEETAVLFEAKNAEELAGKMYMLLNNHELCKRIAVEGKLYLQTICNERVMAKEIEEIIAVT